MDKIKDTFNQVFYEIHANKDATYKVVLGDMKLFTGTLADCYAFVQSKLEANIK